MLKGELGSPACVKCHSTRITIDLHDDLKGATITCAVCGPYEVYRLDCVGKTIWETAEQRCARTKRTLVCKKCGEKFYDYLGGDLKVKGSLPHRIWRHI